MRVSCLVVRYLINHLGYLLSFATLCATIAAAGCSGGDASSDTTSSGSHNSSSSSGNSGGNSGPPELAVVHGATGAPSSVPKTDSYAFVGYATSLSGLGSFVAIGTTIGIYEAAAEGKTTLRPIIGDDPNLPLETGIVRATVKYEDGVLVAADNGVFFMLPGALQPSVAADTLLPLGIKAMQARVADEDGDGAVETNLSIRGEKGAYELGPSNLVTWTVEGEDGAPSAIMAQKNRVYLAYGRRVYEIDKADGKAYPLVFDIGYVQAIACGSLECDEGSLIYFASDAGLIERSSNGQYSRYTLAAEGEAAVPVEGFALDGKAQRLYAVAGERVLRVRAGEVPEAVAMLNPATAPRGISTDKDGNVWVAEGQTATRFAVGEPLRFAKDVQPIMHEYCSGCHVPGILGAPIINFEDYQTVIERLDRILIRVVEQRSMPPVTYEKKMPASSIAILKEWAIDKAP